ncbi:HAD-like protein [Phlegmacium glaucopus]|nr:HAD-like protein [Phlegmacium glaucopus]
MGYIINTSRIAAGGQGPSSVDVMHREILDNMLKSDDWCHIGALWDDSTREVLNLVWHRLEGWPDTVQGLSALKKQVIITTLSNGNVRLLIDMAKHSNLPWDMIFSTELFDTFKPNPKAYLQAIHHLSLPPSQCAMVAAHIKDLHAAASVGMKTIYVRRSGEDPMVGDGVLVRSKDEGGEVDCVVDSFLELSEVIEHLRTPKLSSVQE